MKASEIIEFRPEADAYVLICQDAAMYSVRSLPFTIDRMGIGSTDQGLLQRVENIAKGKVAEGLFRLFCRSHYLPVDFNTPSTPYYQTDMRDFLFLSMEWDIKNNFYHVPDPTYDDLLEFPALIPSRNTNDQWSKRTQLLFPQYSARGTAFVFTFMPYNSLRHWIGIDSYHLSLVRQLCSRYRGLPLSSHPGASYEQAILPVIQSLSIHIPDSVPPMFITAYADEHSFNLFRPVGAGRRFCTTRGDLIIKTRIRNMYAYIRELPPFQSLIP